MNTGNGEGKERDGDSGAATKKDEGREGRIRQDSEFRQAIRDLSEDKGECTRKPGGGGPLAISTARRKA